MKKQPKLLLFCASAIFFASNNFAETYYDLDLLHDFKNTFGAMASRTEMAGIGIVVENIPAVLAPKNVRDAYVLKRKREGIIDNNLMPGIIGRGGYYTVRITHPFVGCASNQEIRVENEMAIYREFYLESIPSIKKLQEDPEAWQEHLKTMQRYDACAPTNNARIVFDAVFLDSQRISVEDIADGSTAKKNLPVIDRLIRMNDWWHDTAGNKEITSYFSSVIDCVRTDSNWTNYYALCRNGLDHPNKRISQSAKVDIWNIINTSNDEKLQYMLDDPLLPNTIKTIHVEPHNEYRYNEREYEANTLGKLAKCAEVAGIGVVLEGVKPEYKQRERDAYASQWRKTNREVRDEYERLRPPNQTEDERIKFDRKIEADERLKYEPFPELADKPGWYIIRVEHPFVGCVKGQEIRVEKQPSAMEEPPIEWAEEDPEWYEEELRRWKAYQSKFPAKGARIVFSAEYYHYERWYWEGAGNWNLTHDQLPVVVNWIYDEKDRYGQYRLGEPDPPPPPPPPPVPENAIYIFSNDRRSWWHDNEKNALLTAQFSNIVDAVRVNRNWTNYYELCRDGLRSPVKRIRWDAEKDLVNLFKTTSAKRLFYIQNNYELPPSLKDELNWSLSSVLWQPPQHNP